MSVTVNAKRSTVAITVAAVLLGVLAVGAVSSLTGSVPDFSELTVGPERKGEFFAFVHPLVESENARVLRQRQKLQMLDREDAIGWLERRWIAGLAREYGVDTGDIQPAAVVDRLLYHVDLVPESLALAQAAKESGWGTSRFAREGNNLFGEWCYEQGCGVVPSNRADGRDHEVERFSTPAKSVRSYIRNINTHNSSKGFRDARAARRAMDEAPSGLALATELAPYSERRLDYVEELISLIEANDLTRFDTSSDQAEQ
jgi:Bax protein